MARKTDLLLGMEQPKQLHHEAIRATGRPVEVLGSYLVAGAAQGLDNLSPIGRGENV